MNTLPAGRIVSLQVGMPQRLVAHSGREWESAIVKQPVDGPVRLEYQNLNGDYQANRRYHGGPDKAVCGYSTEHYPDWRRYLSQKHPEREWDHFDSGAFGENITVEGLTEDVLCIGDTLSVGDVRLQVSQPRQPCANISKRWVVPTLPGIMQQTGRTGFYCRVLQTGDMATGDDLQVIERFHPDWTLLRANQIMYADAPDTDELIDLRSLSLLSAEWKRILGRTLAKQA